MSLCDNDDDIPVRDHAADAAAAAATAADDDDDNDDTVHALMSVLTCEWLAGGLVGSPAQ